MAIQSRSTNKTDIYARRIKILAKNRGITLRKLDELCGFLPGRVSQITSKCGTTGNPRENELYLISEQLNASELWLSGAPGAMTPSGIPPDRSEIGSHIAYREILGEFLEYIDQAWVNKLFQGQRVGLQRALAKLVKINTGGSPWPELYRHQFARPTTHLANGLQAKDLAITLGIKEELGDEWLRAALEAHGQDINQIKRRNSLVNYFLRCGDRNSLNIINYYKADSKGMRIDISQAAYCAEVLPICDPANNTFDQFLVALQAKIESDGRDDPDVERISENPQFAMSCRFKQDQKKSLHGIYCDAVKLTNVILV